jgi:hypothetical protein
MRTITTSFLTVWLCGLAFAQADQARIVGTVTDSAGAVIPGATVHVKNQRTAAERSVTTNGQGRYIITGLPPTEYAITASSPGFGPVAIAIARFMAACEAASDMSITSLSSGDASVAGGSGW